MDKEKNPIKEENALHVPKKYPPNVASSSSQPPVLKMKTAVLEPTEETIVLDEMEESDEEEADFIFNSSTTDYVDDSPPPSKNIPMAPSAQAPASIAKRSGIRKAMPLEELEKLAKTDPKRATRIITNRRSAMRAKEKKKLYTYTLEVELQKLKSQAAQSSAELTLLGAEHDFLAHENSKLEDGIDVLKRMIVLQDSKIDEIRKEIQLYKYLLETQRHGAIDINKTSFSAASANVNGLKHAAQQGSNSPSQTTHEHQPQHQND